MKWISSQVMTFVITIYAAKIAYLSQNAHFMWSIYRGGNRFFKLDEKSIENGLEIQKFSVVSFLGVIASTLILIHTLKRERTTQFRRCRSQKAPFKVLDIESCTRTRTENLVSHERIMLRNTRLETCFRKCHHDDMLHVQ